MGKGTCGLAHNILNTNIMCNEYISPILNDNFSYILLWKLKLSEKIIYVYIYARI